MPITLDPARLEYKDYFEWYRNELRTLFNIPPTLANGLSLVSVNDLKTEFNFFAAASDFYANAVLDTLPDIIRPYTPILERIIRHWSVTGEFCLVIQNGILDTIRPDYVFPVFAPENADVIVEYLFVFPLPNTASQARVVRFNPYTGEAGESIRTLAGNSLQAEGYRETPVNIQAVFWRRTQAGFYPAIKGLVRELNIRLALFQLALNSTAYPLLQVSTEGLAGGRLATAEITPAKVAGLAKTGIGLVVPPPFIGEEGARYVERLGTGLTEAMEYVKMVLGGLSVMSGVPEYVFGTNLSDTSAEVERVMFMGQSRINRLYRALEFVFGELGVEVRFGNAST